MPPKYNWKAATRSAPAPTSNVRSDAGNGITVPLSATDPAAVGNSLATILGGGAGADKLGRHLADLVDQRLRELGVDATDRRHMMFPERAMYGDVAQFADQNGNVRWSMSDLTSRNWDGAGVRERRTHLMGGWIRSILSGMPFSQSIGGEISSDMVRAMSTSDGAGGTLIPPGFIAELVKDIPKLSNLWVRARKMKVGERSGTIPSITNDVTAYWGSENTEITESNATTGSYEYVVRRLNLISKMSREIMQESNPDIVMALMELISQAGAAARDEAIAIGSGSGQPMGLYSASGFGSVTSTYLDYNVLLQMKGSIDERFHSDPSFCWTGNQNMKNALQLIKDQDGLPIFRDAKGGDPATFLNVPFATEASFPNSYLGIGCMRYYLWFDRGIVGIEKTTEGGTAFIDHQMWVKMFEYADGKPVFGKTCPFVRATSIATINNYRESGATYNTNTPTWIT